MKDILTKLNSLHKLAAFDKYCDLLLEWNNKFNLTAITEVEEIKQKHFIDSLAAVEYIPNGATVLDIGSGAGFPGIPLKIVRDDLTVTLLDSVNKKVTFLTEVISKLGLENIIAVHSRIEDLAQKQSYDVVVSRAVAALNVLAEYALPFVKIGGKFIAYKSEKTDEEIINAANALKTLGGKVEDVIDVSSGGNNRKLIIIKKIAPSPSKYPRGKNLPRVKPL